MFASCLGRLYIVHFCQNIKTRFMLSGSAERDTSLTTTTTNSNNHNTSSSVSRVSLLRLGKVVALCPTSWMTSLLQWWRIRYRQTAALSRAQRLSPRKRLRPRGGNKPRTSLSSMQTSPTAGCMIVDCSGSKTTAAATTGNCSESAGSRDRLGTPLQTTLLILIKHFPWTSENSKLCLRNKEGRG